MGPGEHLTAADRRRFDTLQDLGCLIARVFFDKPNTPGEVHHVLTAGRRTGHQATLYLAPWYHRGVPPTVRHAGRLLELTVAAATTRYGPSLALDRPAFEARFASEVDLLAMQDELVAMYDRGARGLL